MELEPTKINELARRKIQLAASPSSNGIGSGVVIVSGHPLRGPYKFEFQGSRLFVNGIQIQPSLIEQRETERHHQLSDSVKAACSELEELMRRVHRHYVDHHGKMSDDQLRADVLSMVLASSQIKDAHWGSETELFYHMSEPSMSKCPFLHDFGPQREGPSQAALAARNRVEELLRNAHRYYAERHGKTPEEQLCAEILSRILRCADIKEAQWNVPGFILEYSFSEPSLSMLRSIYGFSPLPPEKTREELQKEHIEMLEDDLRNGRCLFYVGFDGQWKGDDIRAAVRRVMEAADISVCEKEKQLAALFGETPAAALDIIANYDPGEWR